jgi:hypothetical protein
VASTEGKNVEVAVTEEGYLLRVVDDGIGRSPEGASVPGPAIWAWRRCANVPSSPGAA